MTLASPVADRAPERRTSYLLGTCRCRHGYNSSRTRPRDTPRNLYVREDGLLSRLVSNWAHAVTTEADAAKGTFYLYFASWDDMLVAVRDRVLRAT